MCRNGCWACWGEILKYQRHIVVSCCVFLNPLKERQLLPVGRSAFSILWLQWLSGSIVWPLVKCFDVKLFIVLCGGEMPLIWQTLAWSTMNIATFRQTGVCWPGLMSHSFSIPTGDYIISTLAAQFWSAYHSATFSNWDFQNICSKLNIKIYLCIYVVHSCVWIGTGLLALNFCSSCLSHQATLLSAALCLVQLPRLASIR